MPEIIVKIEWDWPDDPYWLCPDNVWYCLQKTCPKTHFKVEWVEGGNPWAEETNKKTKGGKKNGGKKFGFKYQ